MSVSRKSLKSRSHNFNPRAENAWSKDDSKFGQRMLEKMGWSKGQGIGLRNQGISDNVKIRLKLDNKGLGFQVKEDQLVEVQHDFSQVLSQLREASENIESEKKPSLESTSQTLKSRVHYHKFIRGKDISKYSKKDLTGIFGHVGIEECSDSENQHFNQSEESKTAEHFNNDNIFAEKQEKECIRQLQDTVPENTAKSSKKRKKTEDDSKTTVKNKKKNRSADIIENDNKIERTTSKSELSDFLQSVTEFNKIYDTQTKESKSAEHFDNDNIFAEKREKECIRQFEDTVPENTAKSSKKRKKTERDSKSTIKNEKKNRSADIIENDNKIERTTSKSKLSDFLQSVIEFNKINDTQTEESKTAEHFDNDNIFAEKREKECIRQFEDTVPENTAKSSKKRKKTERDSKSTIKNEKKNRSADIIENDNKIERTTSKSELSDFLQSLTEFNKINDAQTEESKTAEHFDNDNIFAEKQEKECIRQFEDTVPENTAKSSKKRKKTERYSKSTIKNEKKNRSADIIENDNKIERTTSKSELSDFLQSVTEFNKINDAETEESKTAEHFDNDNIFAEKQEKECIRQFEDTVPENTAKSSKKRKKTERYSKSTVKNKKKNRSADIIKNDNKIERTASKSELSDFLQSVTEFNKINDAETEESKTAEHFDNDNIFAEKQEKECIRQFEDKVPENTAKSSKKRKKTERDSKSTIKNEKKNRSADIIENDNKIERTMSKSELSDFLQSVIEFNKINDTENFIQRFEEKKEELLNRYRENYRRKMLSLQEERIYCDLDGDELDTKYDQEPANKCIESTADEKKTPNFDNFKFNLTNLKRNLTNAEKIVYKARLLKMIQSDNVIHEFEGSNLNEINGYGNEDTQS